MAFSFSRLIISEASSGACVEAFALLEEASPVVRRLGTAACAGAITGHEIWLGFKKGVPAWKCSCTPTLYAQTENPCAPAIALALAWDRSRAVPDPSFEDATFICQK
jgi:hypothetical protein